LPAVDIHLVAVSLPTIGVESIELGHGYLHDGRHEPLSRPSTRHGKPDRHSYSLRCCPRIVAPTCITGPEPSAPSDGQIRFFPFAILNWGVLGPEKESGDGFFRWIGCFFANHIYLCR